MAFNTTAVLILDHLRNAVGEKIVDILNSQLGNVFCNSLGIHTHLFGESRDEIVALDLFGHISKIDLDLTVKPCLVGNTHNGHVSLCLFLCIKLGNVILEDLRFFGIGKITVAEVEGKTGENVVCGVCKLCFDSRRGLGFFNNIFGKLACVSDRAGKHTRNSILIGSDYTNDLEGRALVVKIFQTGT